MDSSTDSSVDTGFNQQSFDALYAHCGVSRGHLRYRVHRKRRMPSSPGSDQAMTSDLELLVAISNSTAGSLALSGALSGGSIRYPKAMGRRWEPASSWKLSSKRRLIPVVGVGRKDARLLIAHRRINTLKDGGLARKVRGGGEPQHLIPLGGMWADACRA